MGLRYVGLGVDGAIQSSVDPRMNLLENSEAMYRLRKKLANEKERLVKVAISKALGNDQWHFEDLIDRIKVTKLTYSKLETYYLDNKPIIIFYPIRYEKISCRDKVNFTGKQFYKLL